MIDPRYKQKSSSLFWIQATLHKVTHGFSFFSYRLRGFLYAKPMDRGLHVPEDLRKLHLHLSSWCLIFLWHHDLLAEDACSEDWLLFFPGLCWKGHLCYYYCAGGKTSVVIKLPFIIMFPNSPTFPTRTSEPSDITAPNAFCDLRKQALKG